MEAQLADLFTQAAAAHGEAAPEADATRDRILDAALAEAASVGVERLTVEDVVRRSGLGRMTVYRRFSRRDELVRALVLRETGRFLEAVAAGIARAPGEPVGVVEAFVAAMAFVRAHPMLRRVADTSPGAVFDAAAADERAILAMGSAFIAGQIHGGARGSPSRQVRWTADVLARLFLTYVAIPPADPDPTSDAQLRRFAREVVTPIVERAAVR